MNMNTSASKTNTGDHSAKTSTRMPRARIPLPTSGGCLAALLLAFTGFCAPPEPAESVPSTTICIDISKHYTAHLTDSLNSPAFVKENNLAELPKGRQVFLGVPFEVGGLVQLSGKKLQEYGRMEYPQAVNDIKLEKRCQRLHLLHGAGGVFDPERVTIAKLVLHYADKSLRELDIHTGVHVLDWWGYPKQAPTGTNSHLAWTGTNLAMKKYPRVPPESLRIYKTTFENPPPEIAITSIDYLSTMRNSSPFLIGLTVE